MKSPMLPQKLAFVDIETTGGSFEYGRIIEIAILRVENNTLIDTYQTLINPQKYIPQEIEEITGINTHMLENAPTFTEIKRDVSKFLKDCIFVAHNVRFDYNFIRNELRREGTSFTAQCLCTAQLSKKLYSAYKKHNLDCLIERFGFECEHRHRAYDDAKVLWDFYRHIQKEFTEDIIKEALHRVLKKSARPLAIPQETFDRLPEAPGVYIFYGDKGTPLYIGKSKNIKDRVLSHFSHSATSSTELKIAQQIEGIETIQTRGELGALFKESHLVKTMQPLYNRQLRQSRQLIVLKQVTSQKGFLTVQMETAESINPADLTSIVGIFRSQKQMKDYLLFLAKEHLLCQKLLGIEKSNRSCFGYHLGSCRGACVGKEKSVMYNLRFISAFSKTKIKQWPFKNALVIKEKDSETSESEVFVFYNWCYVGTIREVEQDQEIRVEKDFIFDYDMYKILIRYLYDTKRTPHFDQIALEDLPFKQKEWYR